jgi:hypothetical protein
MPDQHRELTAVYAQLLSQAKGLCCASYTILIGLVVPLRERLTVRHNDIWVSKT